jgi:hypothetical protein
MPKYRVAVLKEVADLLRVMVDVEAASADEAVEKVREMNKDDWDFHWWQSINSSDGYIEYEYDARELYEGEDFNPGRRGR